MLTSTNRNKVSLIKVLNHYFYISLVDVKNNIQQYTPLARLPRFSRARNSLPISFQTSDTQATDSVSLITPLTTQIKSLIFTRLMKEIKCSYNFDSVELHALKSSLKCLENKGKFYARSPINKNTKRASLTKR